MTARNPITGDLIQTGAASKEFNDNFDAVFGKKVRETVIIHQCDCGRLTPCDKQECTFEVK